MMGAMRAGRAVGREEATAADRWAPDFLVIGAMKCGTTTLYADLEGQPAFRMSKVKEASVLIQVRDPDKVPEYYRRLFEGEPGARRFGEASTLYSQLPRHAGVPERARELLGPDLRFIYLVRNPVERAISNHYHRYAAGDCGPDVDAAVRSESTLVDFGRYAMQLEAWVRVFGPEAALVLRFEDYVRDRAGGLQRVGDFLSVPVDVSKIQCDTAFNQSEGKMVPRPILRRLSRTSLAFELLRVSTPEPIRRIVKKPFFARAPERPRPPRADTIDYLIEKLAPDADRLASMVGWKAPVWDFESTRGKYSEVRP